MQTKETGSPQPAPWRTSLMVLLTSGLLLFSAVLLESCAETAKPDGQSHEMTKTEPTKDNQEPTTNADVTSEIAPDPGARETKSEPGSTTSETTPEVTNPEPADAGELVADARDAGPGAPCTGIQPPYPDAAGTLPPDIEVPENPPADAGCQYKPGQCVGSDVPAWKLEDFQPQSCGYKKSYNLKAFRGYVTVVALLSGW